MSHHVLRWSFLFLTLFCLFVWYDECGGKRHAETLCLFSVAPSIFSSSFSSSSLRFLFSSCFFFIRKKLVAKSESTAHIIGMIDGDDERAIIPHCDRWPIVTSHWSITVDSLLIGQCMLWTLAFAEFDLINQGEEKKRRTGWSRRKKERFSTRLHELDIIRWRILAMRGNRQTCRLTLGVVASVQLHFDAPVSSVILRSPADFRVHGLLGLCRPVAFYLSLSLSLIPLCVLSSHRMIQMFPIVVAARYFSLLAVFLSLSSLRRTGPNQNQRNYSTHLSTATVFLLCHCC